MQTGTTAERRTPDREAIRTELEQTRRDFHALLGSLSDAERRRTSGNPAWTVGQLMWHLASGVGFMAGVVHRARRGKGFNPPAFLVDRLNMLITRWGSRRATRRSITELYDTGHAKLIAALETIDDSEWGIGSRSFGVSRTVESLFHSIKEHFDEHQADIQAVR